MREKTFELRDQRLREAELRRLEAKQAQLDLTEECRGDYHRRIHKEEDPVITDNPQ